MFLLVPLSLLWKEAHLLLVNYNSCFNILKGHLTGTENEYSVKLSGRVMIVHLQIGTLASEQRQCNISFRIAV